MDTARDWSNRKGDLIVKEFECEPCELDFISAYITESLFDFGQANNISIFKQASPFTLYEFS